MGERIPPSSSTEEFIDRHQAAAFLSCSPNTITRLIRAGRLKAGDIGIGRNRHYRIALAELRRFQTETAAPTPDAPVRRRRRRRKVIPNLA